MFYLLNSLWNYSCLTWKIYQNYFMVQNKIIKDELNESTINQVVQDLIPYIDRCGCVCIKFTQWITPILDLMYNKEYNEPYWLRMLEKYYEDCKDHSLNYSLRLFKKEMNYDFNTKYEIVDIIGSGSIGQVYKIKSINSDKIFAMKILHPNVGYDMWIFRKITNIVLNNNRIKQIIKKLLPIDLHAFILDFEKQVDMYREAGNLLRMSYNYKDNDYINIPRLVSFSPNILLMEYEEGFSIDDKSLSEYEKMKTINLLSLFSKNNFEYLYFNHGDLHKGNWKLQPYKNTYRLVFYDFGFCWENNNIEISKIICDAFVDSDKNDYSIMVRLVLLILNETEDNVEITNHVKNGIDDYINENETVCLSNPKFLFKLFMSIAKEFDIEVDINNLQSILAYIQIYKYMEYFGLSNISPVDNIYRNNYVESISICDAYGIFEPISTNLKLKMNKRQVSIDTVFGDVEFDDNIKNLLTFD